MPENAHHLLSPGDVMSKRRVIQHQRDDDLFMERERVGKTPHDEMQQACASERCRTAFHPVKGYAPIAVAWKVGFRAGESGNFICGRRKGCCIEDAQMAAGPFTPHTSKALLLSFAFLSVSLLVFPVVQPYAKRQRAGNQRRANQRGPELERLCGLTVRPYQQNSACCSR